MQTFIDPVEFCDCVMAEAKAQGWDLVVMHGTGMRFTWQWIWKGQHPLPERSSMFPGESEARFAACLEIVKEARWSMQLAPGVPQPMELELNTPPPSMADAVATTEDLE